MSKIKIKDLPKNMKISKAEMEKITGGALKLDPNVLSAFDFGEIGTFAKYCQDGSSKKDSIAL